MAKSKTKNSPSKVDSQTVSPETEVAVAPAQEAAPAVDTLDAGLRVKKQDFIDRLSEKLTHFDAHLVLEAAMLSAGISGNDAENDERYFKKEETRNICLALIKRGGPAFSVGTRVYREVIGG